MDGNESKSPTDVPLEATPNHEKMNGKRRFYLKSSSHDTILLLAGDASTAPENNIWSGNQASVKAEPVCVFLNQNYDSSDSEHQPCAVEEKATKM